MLYVMADARAARPRVNIEYGICFLRRQFILFWQHFQCTISEERFMKIKDIVKAKGSTVFSIHPDKTVRDAIEMLIQYNIGSLLVVDDARPVGIFTERDTLRICASEEGRLAEIRIGDVMTSDLIIGRLEDDVEDMMKVMTDKHIRHLPVLEQGFLAGMVSIGDLVKSQLDEKTVTILYLRDYITGNDMR
jgi:CBS domain-containing protein